LPKTLFGEKYVALQVPSSPSPRSIQAGDTISESHVAIEVEKVLNDLYPLLRTVQPAQLNYTLTAMADALEGRGEKLGRNLVVLDDYLRRMNPKIPLLIDDLGKLATVSDTYAQVAPELATLLRNSVTTGNTFVQKEAKVQALFDDVASFSSTSRDFLEQNGSNIIRLSKQGQAQLPLFAKYAPEYPCLLNGMTDWVPRMESAYRGYTLHINLETLPSQPTGYSPADRPRYAAHNGPHCSELPHPPHSQANPGPQPAIHEVDDGVSGGHGKFRPRSAPGFDRAVDSGFDMTSGYAGTASERTLVNAFAAPAMGVAQDDVPDLASLLLGPLARGAEVSVR
jgi:phospholipid/cholesterol/gamma-HCH transport system substrate-binding protein